MEGIIQHQTEGEVPDEVIELDLEGWKSKSISPSDKKLLENHPNLDSLSFSGCGLESLENFPSFENLVRLDLSDNNLKSGLTNLKHLTEIMQINLENNKFERIEELNELASLENLISIMVEGNPLAAGENYREKIFKAIPGLQVVDGLNKEGEEVEFNDEDELDDDQSFSGEEFDDEDDEEEEEEESESEEPLPRKRGADQRGKKK